MKKTPLLPLSAALTVCFSLLCGCAANGSSEKNVATAAPETESAPAGTESVSVKTAAEPEDEPGDTSSPFFVHFTRDVRIEVGNTFNVHDHVSYIDDTDRDVTLEIDGAVDEQTVGEYPLTLTLTDDSGNSASSEMTVSVAEAVPPDPNRDQYVYPTEEPRPFADFISVYKTDGAMAGIDVSKWQGDIDFGAVAAAGCEFVIIRVGGYAGGLFEDPYFARNIKEAKAAGLKVGVYWYSEEDGPDRVRKNADYLYSLLGGEELDFPVFFDWEDYYHLEDYKMSVRDLNDMFLAFRDEAEAHGYDAVLYNSEYYLDVLWSEEVKKGGVWLAHYVDKTDYGGGYFLWQQGFGSIDGIEGAVDVDVFYPDAFTSFS